MKSLDEVYATMEVEIWNKFVSVQMFNLRNDSFKGE